MSQVKTRLGVKYRLAYTGRNRWGEGKTHIEFYDRLNKMWLLHCKPDAQPFGGYFTSDKFEGDRPPPPCKKCQPYIEDVFLRGK